MLYVLLLILLIIAGVLLYALRQPDSFRIARTAVIHAPPERIFALINDFHLWPQWSPWENRDPAMTRDYSGAAQGVGAVYAWVGNRNVGQGRMEITEAKEPTAITIKLDFLKPFEAHNQALFSIEPQGDQSKITWQMIGPQPFIGKIMSLVFNMEKMVGPDFEQGLANLKRVSEQVQIRS